MIVVCICVLQCLDFEFQEYLRLTFILNATMELIRHYRNNCQGDVFSRCGNEGHVCSLSTVWSGSYSGFEIHYTIHSSRSDYYTRSDYNISAARRVVCRTTFLRFSDSSGKSATMMDPSAARILDLLRRS